MIGLLHLHVIPTSVVHFLMSGKSLIPPPQVEEVIIVGVRRWVKDTLEDGFIIVLIGIDVTPEVCYCGNDILKGYISLVYVGCLL